MRESEFTEFLGSRKQAPETIDAALEAVREFEDYLRASGRDLESVSADDVREYVATLIADERNTLQRLVALARYVYMLGRNEVFIYFTAVVNGQEVYDSISERLAAVTDEATRDQVLAGIDFPPLGSPPETYPPVTARLVSRLHGLGRATCRKVLAGNHHGIPSASFDKHREWFKEAGSLDAFLERLHGEKVKELERHARDGTVWYEQVITPEVVELVRGNREMLSAVRDGEYLYLTKIPFAPGDWLEEKDPKMKRYLACHCPLARAAILSEDAEIPPDWCYCSAGYHRLMFEEVLERPVEIELLESVLAGDDRCRFRLRIP
jgi:hypothetical protein